MLLAGHAFTLTKYIAGALDELTSRHSRVDDNDALLTCHAYLGLTDCGNR